MPDWRFAVLQDIGAKPTPENIRALNAWERAEGTKAHYNPLATTQQAPGATSFNSVGVRNYPDPETGIKATVETLLNGRYGRVIGLLRSGSAKAEQIADAVGASPWGTSGQLMRDVLGSPAAATPPGMARPSPSAPTALPALPAIPADAGPDLAGAIFANLSPSVQRDPLAQLTNLTSAVVQYQQTKPDTTAASTAAPASAPAPSGRTAPNGGSRGRFTIKHYPFKEMVPIIGRPNVPGSTHDPNAAPNNWESDNAWDFSVKVGTPVIAVRDGQIGSQFGKLADSGRFQGYRLHLVAGDNEYYYAHLSRYAPGIKPGTRVQAGQVIGYSGSANGVPHLHFAEKHLQPLPGAA